MGPIRGRQDPGGPHVGPMNFAFWVVSVSELFPHWFKSWFGSCSATNEHLVNQWPFIIYWTLGNKIMWNINKVPKVSFLSCLDDHTNDNLGFVLGQWVHLRFTAFTPIKYQKYFTHMVGLAGMKDCGYKWGYSKYDRGYKSLLDTFNKIYIPILYLNCTLVIFESRDGMC